MDRIRIKILISLNSERDWMNEVCEKLNATLPSALSSPYIFFIALLSDFNNCFWTMNECIKEYGECRTREKLEFNFVRGCTI